MLSTLNRSEQDSHDVIEIAPDVVLAARADRPPTQASGSGPSAPQVRIEPDAGPSAPSADATTFRATAPDDIRLPGERSSFGKWAMRTSIACLFAICSAVAAAAWQRYGNEAQETLAAWTPSRVSLGSLFSLDKLAAPRSSDSTAVTAAAADQASAAAATSQGEAPTAAPAAAPAPTADSAQSMQSMAHDIAAMSRQIAELKAGIDQLKAGQEQMSREMAKAAEARMAEAKASEAKAAEARAAEARALEMRAMAKIRQLPPRPRMAAAPIRKPKPASAPPVQVTAVPPLPSSQPIAPLPPPQTTAQPDGDQVVRPPLPVH